MKALYYAIAGACFGMALAWATEAPYAPIEATIWIVALALAGTLNLAIARRHP